MAAGPEGRTSSADTDLKMHAEILSCSRSRGAFAGVISYFIAKEQEAKPHKIVFQHLLITALVIAGSYFLREVSARLIAKFG